MKSQQIYMTPVGHSKALLSFERKLTEYEQICSERAIAHDLSGDGWHDNPHFNRLQQLEADKSREVATLKAVLANVQIVSIDVNNRPVDAVRLGSVVRLSVESRKTGTSTCTVWEVVGFDETEPNAMKLAYNSPLGAAIIGHEIGEEVTVELADGPSIVLIEDLLTDRELVDPMLEFTTAKVTQAAASSPALPLMSEQHQANCKKTTT